MMTDKLDLYRQHKDEYAAKKTPALVKVGPAKYLTIAGRGAPGGDAFQAAVGGLYSMAFTIKMTRKLSGKGDYKVCHLEGLWWAPGKADLAKARAALAAKGKPPEFKAVKLERIAEGLCVQALHVGPFADEPATVAKMDELAAAEGLKPHGRHHEIYLSDPRRVPPERLRTILRHPVRKK